MDIPSTSRLLPVTLERVVEALRTVGVAGNEEDGYFDANGLRSVREELERRLQESGHAAGPLSIHILDQPRHDVDVLVYDTDRYKTLYQAERAWEDDYQSRWHDRVERGVEDWLGRLADLRTLMATWIEQSPELSGVELWDLEPATMAEGLMKQFNVPPAKMPVFELRSGSRRVMRVLPKGLWVIGSNGRVDLITRSSSPILVDRSELFARPSDWQLHHMKDGLGTSPFTLDIFRTLVCPDV